MKISYMMIAAAVLALSATAVLARGQGGPIGPGSRDGLTPSASQNRFVAYPPERPAPVTRRPMKRQRR